MNLIFFNIGWMKSYCGEDNIWGNFKFLAQQKEEDNKLAHEKWNFFPYNGICYGYVPLKWQHNDTPPKMNIQRVNKSATDKLEDVTVVFISKNPLDNITYIIGWYRHATLYRQFQKRPRQKEVSEKNIYYAASAQAEDIVCLSENERNFEVPTAQKMGKHKGYGETPIWYLDTKEIQPYRRKVEKYINEFTPNIDLEKINLWNGKVDPEHNKEIEQKAINIVTTYYQDKEFSVESVEKLNCGFDLVVKKGSKKFYIEVKGNGSSQINISLSPNEYNSLKKYMANYIIASVTNCNEKNVKLNLFNIVKDENNFYIQHIENKDEKYKILEIVGARIIVNN